MKKIASLLWILAFLLAACSEGNEFPSSTPSPTPIPTTIPAAARSLLTAADLTDGFSFDGPLDEAALTPPAQAAPPPAHSFEGRLELQGEKDDGHIQFLRGELGPEYTSLPEFDFAFVQENGWLVPVRRGNLITDHPGWNIILEPGRVWQEPGDGGYSRASLPFALTVKGGNAVFNGTLTFLFDDRRVSKVWYQVTQETTTYTRANLWGLAGGRISPGRNSTGRSRSGQILPPNWRRACRSSPSQALAEDYPGVDVSAFGRGVTPQHMTWYGVVVNGVNYLGGCQTRFGTVSLLRIDACHLLLDRQIGLRQPGVDAPGAKIWPGGGGSLDQGLRPRIRRQPRRLGAGDLQPCAGYVHRQLCLHGLHDR